MKNTILPLLIIALIFSSCNTKQKPDTDISILFKYEKCVAFDFKNKTVRTFYRGQENLDTILFTKNDSIKLLSSISKNKIDEIRGDYSYPECYWLMPSSEDQIEFFKEGKILNSIRINYRPNCSDTKALSNKEMRNRAFGIDIRNLVLNKPCFKRAMDTLKVYRIRKKGII